MANSRLKSAIVLQRTQQFNMPIECLMDICKNTDKDTAGKAAMVIWVLWNNRNNWVWNHTKKSGQQLGHKALCLWNKWNEVQTVRNHSSRREQQATQWQKLQQLWLKCNLS
ncbi:hypothetical protein L195_g054067 [Trifolium pratense]|uniref:Uncharacterized protein n=1 Tax=Trifolium pratense TaxID=57577 RepID=A0A2K3KE15_TRIPR|nr:hypothetical protein L195_g054067 [Trifolium pratense]